MIEILKQALVPGGLFTGLLLWWTTSHTKKDDEKTEVSAQRQAASQQIVADSGIEGRWQNLFDSANNTTKEIERQLRETQAVVAGLQRREGVHYEYHFALRGQIQDLGATPQSWPPNIDPNTR